MDPSRSPSRSERITTDEVKPDIHRLDQEDQYWKSRSHSKFTKPHLPHLLLHPPDPFQQDEEDVVVSSSSNSTVSTPGSLARLPPFSSFENPLRFKFPAVRSLPPAKDSIDRRPSPLFAPTAPSPVFLSHPPALSQRSSGSTVHSRQSETGSSGIQSYSSYHHISVARRTIRPDFYTSKSGSGSHHVNNHHHHNPTTTTTTTTTSHHQNSPKNSPRTLFTRTELKIGSSQPIVHPRLGDSSRASASSSTVPPPSGNRSTRSKRQEANLLPPIIRGFLSEDNDRFLPTPKASSTSTTNSPRSSSPPFYRTTTTRSLYPTHASTSPFVTQRPRLLQQRNSVSEIKMSQSISPDHPRSGSPINPQREETPTPTLVKREMVQDAYEANEPKERKHTRASESGPSRSEAEADEARDALGKGPDFDFTARRHSLATTAIVSSNGNGIGNGGATALEPIRVGGAYHNTNAPAHPSPLGLGANPANLNTAGSGLTPRTGSGSTTGATAMGPPGPGSAGFRKRKESHDRAAGYVESGHESGMSGSQAPPALPAPSHLASLHLQPPHHSSSSSSNPASTTSHNNVFQVPAPPVFSNPFGQHPSSSSTSIDRLEPPAKRRGSTYDSRMSHLSIAPSGSPPIGPSGEGPGGPGGISGTALPPNSWWNQQPDRRDSTASMYSNRSLASSTGGYGSSNTSYSIMSEKGGYAPPSYSHMAGYMNAPGQDPMHEPRASGSIGSGPLMSASGHYMENNSNQMGDGMGHYSSQHSTPVQEGGSSASGLAHNPAFNALPPDTKEAIGGASFSRSPELRVSHKLAERKRRKEMRDLFDELRDQLPQDRGMKSSKWEILSKAVDHIQTLKRHNSDMAREIDSLRREVEGLRVGAAAAAAASGVTYGVPSNYQQPPFSGYLSMNNYPPPPGSVPSHQSSQPQQAPASSASQPLLHSLHGRGTSS